MRISDWSSDVCSSDLGGYANLHQVHSWTHDFMGRSPWAKKYAETADRIGDALEFMGACGINAESVPQLSQTQFYTSHEALLLRYEQALRSEEHTSELQSLMRISYAVFCLKKQKQQTKIQIVIHRYSIKPQKRLVTQTQQKQ